MKKTLLFVFAALSSATMFAVTDGQTYQEINGIKCENQWVVDRFHDKANFESQPYVNTAARTAAYDGEYVFIASSAADDPEVTTTDAEGKTTQTFCASLHKVDAKTGAYVERLKLTIDGKRLTGTLCANQVGIDNYGNLWVAPAVFSNANGYKVYTVDKTTGAMTLQMNGTMANTSRIDYSDVVGDITRTKDKCTVMGAGSATNFVFCWKAEQGGDFEGGFEGDDSMPFMEMYPETNTLWDGAPVMKIVLGEGDAKYDGELFYIDPFVGYPTLYNNSGSILDSFASAPDLTPETGANGAYEFAINGRNFLTYPYEQYSKEGQGCRTYVVELGEGMAFEGMTKYWQLPENGLGNTSDGGNRVQSFSAIPMKDANDKEGLSFMIFKSFNGVGIYTIADKDFISAGVGSSVADKGATINVSNGIISVSEEASEIAVYNMAGQLVAKASNVTEMKAPTTGAYIIKATVKGEKLIKKAIL